LTNQAEKTERGKYRILPRCSARLATPCKQEDNKSKGSNLKILHYCNKLWKATPASYLVEVTDIHFSEDPKKSTSKRARAERRRDKLYKETNKNLNIRSGHLTLTKGASFAGRQGQLQASNTRNKYIKSSRQLSFGARSDNMAEDGGKTNLSEMKEEKAGRKSANITATPTRGTINAVTPNAKQQKKQEQDAPKKLQTDTKKGLKAYFGAGKRIPALS
jgi:hypothetical protein